MSPTDDLVPLLKKLRLSGVLQSLELRTRQAVDDSLAHSEFLLRLLADEVERRDAKQLSVRIRRANFEHAKTIEDFDFQFNTSVPKAKLLDLATCAFVERQENVLIVGPTGVGKSHLAQALGHRACRAGYAVLYIGATEMLAQLQRLGVIPSFSRPSVSDDNAFIEALFRTLKYRPGYPTKPFETIEAARAWVAEFVAWYNSEHLHSGISFVTLMLATRARTRPSSRTAARSTPALASRTPLAGRAERGAGIT